MAADGLAARGAAVAILDAVLGEGRMLADVLAEPQGPIAGLSPGDRGRAQRLATGVLRHLEQADRVLGPHLRRAPPRSVQNALRLAVVEMARRGAGAWRGERGGRPCAAGAADRAPGGAGERGAAQGGATCPRPLPGLPPQRMPMWLRQPLVHAWGREAVSAIEAVQAGVPPLDLTVRPGAGPLPEGEMLATGSLRLTEAGQITALPGYAEGAWWVQDAAAALPVRLLDPKPGERVLDLCAAPGGKTLQLAAAGARGDGAGYLGPPAWRGCARIWRGPD